jgi:hypothetical protein
MTRFRSSLGLAVVAVVGACHYEAYNPKPPALPVYTITSLGVLAGGTQSQALGGSAAAIVGWATDAGNVRHAVTFVSGAAQRLTEPNGTTSSEARAANASGIIVGNATIGGTVQGVVWASPTSAPMILPSLGGAYTSARSINDLDVILGKAQTDTGDTVITTWQQSGSSYAPTVLVVGDGVDWQPISINNLMDVAGDLGDSGSQAGGFYYNASIGNDTIPLAGSGWLDVYGMSNNGVVVGTIRNTPSPPQAIVYTASLNNAQPLGPPPSGYTGTVALAITDGALRTGGVIGGYAATFDGSGNVLTSVAILSSITNSLAWETLPGLGGSLAQPSSNGQLPCGAFVGWATASGTTPRVAVAWLPPSGCVLP